MNFWIFQWNDSQRKFRLTLSKAYRHSLFHSRSSSLSFPGAIKYSRNTPLYISTRTGSLTFYNYLIISFKAFGILDENVYCKPLLLVWGDVIACWSAHGLSTSQTQLHYQLGVQTCEGEGGDCYLEWMWPLFVVLSFPLWELQGQKQKTHQVKLELWVLLTELTIYQTTCWSLNFCCGGVDIDWVAGVIVLACGLFSTGSFRGGVSISGDFASNCSSCYTKKETELDGTEICLTSFHEIR